MPVFPIQSFKNEYQFLSNFYPAETQYGMIVFPTSEHAYQSAKTLDPEWIDKIRYAQTPGEAKRLGQLAPKRDDWDAMRLQAMHQVLRNKFSDPTLKQMLLDTGDALLVEGNNHGDTFFGVCRGKGMNHLGKLLMKVREELRQSNQTDTITP